MLTKQQLEHFKTFLLEEKRELEGGLKKLGRINPSNPRDWEAEAEDLDIMQADKNEVADSIEEFEENTAILRELEIRLLNVKHALEKFDNGTYGICEKSGNPIDIKRLEANPSAKTCAKHTK